jgi:NDP-sugar pyrophosphorylase family protein
MSRELFEAMVLAGGRGTRLSSVVNDRPKVMANVQGRPFLDFILDHLNHHGFRHVTLLTGFMAEMIEAHYGPRYGAINLRYSQEFSPLGTGGAVKLALSRLINAKSACIILNGDTYFPADLQRVMNLPALNANRVLTTMVDNVSRYGSLDVDPSSSRVQRFLEKGECRAGMINAGTYILDSALISAFPSANFSLEKDLLPLLAQQGKLYAFEDPAPFVDIGIPSDYATFQAMRAIS